MWVNLGMWWRVVGGLYYFGCEYEGFVVGLFVLNGRVWFFEDCSVWGLIMNFVNVV